MEDYLPLDISAILMQKEKHAKHQRKMRYEKAEAKRRAKRKARRRMAKDSRKKNRQ